MTRILALAVLLIAGCAPDITDTDFFREHLADTSLEEPSIELGVIQDGTLTIRVTSPDSLRAGNSIVRAAITVNGFPASNASVTVLPRWVTATRTVISPQGAISLAKGDTPDQLEGIPTFIPPHEQEGVWQLAITYIAGTKSGEAVLPVEVRSSIRVQYTNGFYVLWAQPIRPITGLDVIEFALYRLVDGKFFPVEDARIDLYPWMDMGADQGHSTPYEAPVHAGQGLYRGTVNFIMSGGWDMTVLVQRPNAPQDTVYFKGFTVY